MYPSTYMHVYTCKYVLYMYIYIYVCKFIKILSFYKFIIYDFNIISCNKDIKFNKYSEMLHVVIVRNQLTKNSIHMRKIII